MFRGITLKKILLVLSFFMIPSLSLFAAERVLELTLTSNYVFRGDTQTNDKAAVQANYAWIQGEDAGFYAGFFASNVSQGAEVDVFGGFKLPLGNLILDFGAIEYMYTDSNFKDFSHEFYASVQYDLTYLKYFFGENEATYLDIGTGFKVFADMELLVHYGEVFVAGNPGGNDYSVSLQKEFNSVNLGVTATYEDKAPTKDSEFFAFISVDF